MSWNHFESLTVGTVFEFNGNHFVKQSTRTARMLEYDRRLFYFGMKEVVTIEKNEVTQ
jgi:hypothetical protein